MKRIRAMRPLTHRIKRGIPIQELMAAIHLPPDAPYVYFTQFHWLEGR